MANEMKEYIDELVDLKMQTELAIIIDKMKSMEEKIMDLKTRVENLEQED